MQRSGSGGFGEFEIVLRVDLLERRLRRFRRRPTAISSVSSNTSPSGKGGRISSGVVASSRPFSSASMSSWLLDTAGAGGGGAEVARAWELAAAPSWRRPVAQRESPTEECPSSRAPWLAGAAAAGFSGFAGAAAAGGFFGSRRLGFVVGNDATDRRQNLLHRGFLDLCRLRHLRLHIINALACVLHQARRDLPVPDMQAGIFIAQA